LKKIIINFARDIECENPYSQEIKYVGSFKKNPGNPFKEIETSNGD